MITIEMVEKAWSNLLEFTKVIEKKEDMSLLAYAEVRFRSRYDDLHKNWDENHAYIFMKAMKQLAEYFGFECPEFEKPENKQEGGFYENLKIYS